MKKLLLGSVLSTALLLAACGDSDSETEEMKAEETEVENEESKEPVESEKAEESAEEVSDEESEESEGVKPLENNTYEIEMAKVEVTNTEVIPADDLDEEGKERLVVTYEVTSKVSPEESGEVEVSPMTVWMATVEATQENETSIANLEYGYTPKEYFDYQDAQSDVIKKDATVENVAIYSLDNLDNPVVLNITQGIGGQDLGTIEIDVSE